MSTAHVVVASGRNWGWMCEDSVVEVDTDLQLSLESVFNIVGEVCGCGGGWGVFQWFAAAEGMWVVWTFAICPLSFRVRRGV